MPVQTPPALPKAAPLSIGRYSVIARADFGVADVFRARDPDGRMVAVYLFPGDAAGKGRLIEKLAALFEACTAIEHPNVLRVLDFGPDGTNGYLAAEWVECTTLARMISLHGRLPEGNVLRLAAQIGQGLDHTRAGESALCRPTPGNVLVRTDGLAKLIPFALSGASHAAPAVSGLLKSEFAASAAGDGVGVKRVRFPDAVCALGTLVFEALTGAPWQPPEPEAGKRRRAVPRPLGLTDRADRAVRRATDSDPSNRPATCAEFLKVLRGRPVSAGTPKPDVRSPEAAADNRRGCVRYAVGVGSRGTINTSIFDAADAREEWPLVVQDVSASGVGLLLARRCEPGTELAVEVSAGADGEVRSVPVRVVRVRKDHYGHWTHGCAFLVPLGDAELSALLDHLGRTEA
jgi:serine/threonine protein kinase